MPASIQDVADRANVSISTVSRVLNRRNIVNEKTRKRVESAISELGYSPNVFARGPDAAAQQYPRSRAARTCTASFTRRSSAAPIARPEFSATSLMVSSASAEG